MIHTQIIRSTYIGRYIIIFYGVSLSFTHIFWQILTELVHYAVTEGMGRSMPGSPEKLLKRPKTIRTKGCPLWPII